MTANTHSVTVTTRLEDQGTEDERRVVDRVTFTCTAPDTADCRTYPKCDCESWSWNEAGTHDEDGHARVPGQECWIAGWIDNEMGSYTGADADEMRDDYVPAVDRSGPISARSIDGEYLEWNWASSPEQEERND